jgi:two-component system response regulator YesN
MTKVLIVDDEMLVRVGIKSLIDWEKHGFEIVGFASDGKEALDVIKKTLPDIIVSGQNNLQQKCCFKTI